MCASFLVAKYETMRVPADLSTTGALRYFMSTRTLVTMYACEVRRAIQGRRTIHDQNMFPCFTTIVWREQYKIAHPSDASASRSRPLVS